MRQFLTHPGFLKYFVNTSWLLEQLWLQLFLTELSLMEVYYCFQSLESDFGLQQNLSIHFYTLRLRNIMNNTNRFL